MMKMVLLQAIMVASAYKGIDCFGEPELGKQGTVYRQGTLAVYHGGLYYVGDTLLCSGKLCVNYSPTHRVRSDIFPEDATEKQAYTENEDSGIGYFHCIRRAVDSEHVTCGDSDTSCASCERTVPGTTCTLSNHTEIGLCFSGRCVKACQRNVRCSTACSCAGLNDCASEDSVCSEDGKVENITSVFGYRQKVNGPNGFGYCEANSPNGQKVVKCHNGKICNKFGYNLASNGSSRRINDPQYVCFHEGGRAHHTFKISHNAKNRTCLTDFGVHRCSSYKACMEDGDTYARACVPGCQWYAPIRCSSAARCSCQTPGDCSGPLDFCDPGQGLVKHTECKYLKSRTDCVTVRPCFGTGVCAACAENRGDLCRVMLGDVAGDLGVCHNGTCASLALVGGSISNPLQYGGTLFAHGLPVCGDAWNAHLAMQACVKLGYQKVSETTYVNASTVYGWFNMDVHREIDHCKVGAVSFICRNATNSSPVAARKRIRFTERGTHVRCAIDQNRTEVCHGGFYVIRKLFVCAGRVTMYSENKERMGSIFIEDATEELAFLESSKSGKWTGYFNCLRRRDVHTRHVVCGDTVNGTTKSDINGTTKTNINGTTKSDINGTDISGTTKSDINGTDINGTMKSDINGTTKSDINGMSSARSCAACTHAVPGTTCTLGNHTELGLCFSGRCVKACQRNVRCSTACSCAGLNDCASKDSVCSEDGKVENITSVFGYRQKVNGPNVFGYCEANSPNGQKVVKCHNGKICNKFGYNPAPNGPGRYINDPQYVCFNEGGRVYHFDGVLNMYDIRKKQALRRTCLTNIGALVCPSYTSCIEDGASRDKACVPACRHDTPCSNEKPCTCVSAGDCTALSYCRRPRYERDYLVQHQECPNLVYGYVSLPCMVMRPCFAAIGEDCAACRDNSGDSCRAYRDSVDGILGVCLNGTCTAGGS